MLRHSKKNNPKNDSEEAIQSYIDLLLYEKKIHDSINRNDISEDSASISEISRKSQLFLKQFDKAQKQTKINTSGYKGYPYWAKEPFSCQLFKVSGLLFGVPSFFIKEINAFVLDKNNISNRPSKLKLNLLGKISFADENDGNIDFPIIDTANLIIPEHYTSSMIDEYRHVIRFKDLNWLLAIDSIGGEVTINPNEVRWRSEHTRRKWLSGTIVDKMCALIDIDMIDDILLTRKVLED